MVTRCIFMVIKMTMSVHFESRVDIASDPRSHGKQRLLPEVVGMSNVGILAYHNNITHDQPVKVCTNAAVHRDSSDV